MGFFTRIPDTPTPLGDTSLTINGDRQTKPEESGDRRLRLLGACRKAIEVTELQDGFMNVFGPGTGLDEARSVVSAVMSKERSLLELVGLRAVTAYLAMNRTKLGVMALCMGWSLEGEEWTLA